MDDKNIMATILGNLKGGCDLMMHGSFESNTANVRSAFNCALNDFLKMQSDTYSKMSAKGWYPTQTAEQTKIDQAKQKFASA